MASTTTTTSTSSRLKRTSGWFSNAKANLKGAISQQQSTTPTPSGSSTTPSTTSGSSSVSVNNTSPRNTSTLNELKRNGSITTKGMSSLSRRGSSTKHNNNNNNLTIKTTDLGIREEEVKQEVEAEGEGELPPDWIKDSERRKEKIFGAVKDEWPLYSCRAEDYTILEPIGFGSSSVVHLATYKPLNSPKSQPGLTCAIKIIDVDKLSSVGDIDRLRRETQLMALSKHSNVLRVRGEWIKKSQLFIAVRYMTHGSLADISRFAYPDGFQEEVIATVLSQALKGLVYLHLNGWLHRDIKAANLLVDDDGTVLLADFGVSSSLFQETTTTTTSLKDSTTSNSSNNSKPKVPRSSNMKEGEEEEGIDSPYTARKSFVGTPCWMSPEVVQRKPYDSKADVWSFGITALELACGRAPNSLFPPAKALSKTLLDDPPELDRVGGKYKYSKSFKEMVDLCLQKDPKKRPTAEKLLQHSFFKTYSKKKSYLVSTILQDLPPLQDRQQRRRRQNSLMDRTDTISSSCYWDFNQTLPSTPITPSTSTTRGVDPFAGFSTNNSPYNTLSSPTSGLVKNGINSHQPQSPSSNPSSSSNFDKMMMLQQQQVRKRDNNNSSSHRRNISFDFGEQSQPPNHHQSSSSLSSTPTSPIGGNGGGFNNNRRLRDLSIASSYSNGSVRFARVEGEVELQSSDQEEEEEKEREKIVKEEQEGEGREEKGRKGGGEED
ncbi:hypothetical protein JCM5350_005521 [Sporobolomyces pararoseus]